MSTQSLIQEILSDELAPKRAEALAQRIAKAIPTPAPEAPTPAAALAILAKVVNGAAPTTKAAPAKKAAAKPTAAPAPAPAASPKPRRAAAKPAKAVKAKATKAKRVASPKRGRRKLGDDVREGMAKKKTLYWALHRQVSGAEPHDTDADIIKSFDAAFVKRYRAQVKERLEKEGKLKAAPAAAAAAPAKAKARSKAKAKAEADEAPAPAASPKPRRAKLAPAPEPEAEEEAIDEVEIDETEIEVEAEAVEDGEDEAPHAPGVNGLTEKQREALGL